MNRLIPSLSLAVVAFFITGCKNPFEKTASQSPDLPLSPGIQVAFHTSGGIAGLNDTVQISDHWQLTSVGRRHGWVRKLDPDEQRQLVRATQSFEFLSCDFATPAKADGINSTIFARGTGQGTATVEQAEALMVLLEKFINQGTVASR